MVQLNNLSNILQSHPERRNHILCTQIETLNTIPITQKCRIYKLLQIVLLMVCLTSINFLAVNSDLTLGSSQRADVAHVDHGLSKGFKESRLVVGKVINNGDCGSTISGEEFLVCLKKTFVNQKIGEIVVVKSIRG